MNRSNKTGYVRDRARPGRARVTTFHPYRVNALTHPRQQTILMKYHALFVIFEKAEKIETIVCCKL